MKYQPCHEADELARLHAELLDWPPCVLARLSSEALRAHRRILRRGLWAVCEQNLDRLRAACSDTRRLRAGHGRLRRGASNSVGPTYDLH